MARNSLTVKKCRQKLYVAGPLFSVAERAFNHKLKTQLAHHFDVYLPQEDGLLIVDLIAKGMEPADAAARVFAADVSAMKRSDILLIVLDGRAVDEGAAFELGYASAIGKTCIALQTDFRRLAPFGNNPMLTGAISILFESVDALVQWAAGAATNELQPNDWN